jgi:BON domain
MLLQNNSSIVNAAVLVSTVVDPIDRDLQRRVHSFLSTSHRPALRALDVEARGGVVVLRGKVRTFYEKQLSAQLTRRVAGVVRLVDQIVVNRPQNEIASAVVTVRLQPNVPVSGIQPSAHSSGAV